MYSGVEIKNMALTISKYKSIHLNGQVYTTKSDFRGNYARVFARWTNDNGEIDPSQRTLDLVQSNVISLTQLK